MQKYGGMVHWRSYKKGEVDEGGCKVTSWGPFTVDYP